MAGMTPKGNPMFSVSTEQFKGSGPAWGRTAGQQGYFAPVGKAAIGETTARTQREAGNLRFIEAHARRARNEENQQRTIAGDSLRERRARMRAAREQGD